MFKVFKIFFSLILAAILLFLTFQGSDLKRIYVHLGNVDSLFIGLAIFVDFVIVGLRTLRWKYIISHIQKVRFTSVFRSITIGMMMNTILPLRLDEFVRAFVLSFKEKIPKAQIIGTIVIERMWDIVFLIGILGAVSLSVDVPESLNYSNWITVAVLSVFFVVFLSAYVYRDRFSNWIGGYAIRLFPTIGQKFAGVLSSFVSGIRILPTVRGLLVPPLCTFLEWILAVIFFRLIFLAFGFDMPLLNCFLAVVVSYVSFALTFSPAALGVFEYLHTLIFTGVFGMQQEVALSIIIVAHVLLSIPVSLAGIAFVIEDGLTIKELGGD